MKQINVATVAPIASSDQACKQTPKGPCACVFKRNWCCTSLLQRFLLHQPDMDHIFEDHLGQGTANAVYQSMFAPNNFSASPASRFAGERQWQRLPPASISEKIC